MANGTQYSQSVMSSLHHNTQHSENTVSSVMLYMSNDKMLDIKFTVSL